MITYRPATDYIQCFALIRLRRVGDGALDVPFSYLAMFREGAETLPYGMAAVLPLLPRGGGPPKVVEGLK